MFPQYLDSSQAFQIAKAIVDGFNRHYRLFRAESARAKHRFETADWHGQQRGQRERIEFYSLRVKEAVARLEKEFKAGELPVSVWHQIKLHFVGLLVDHHQPELAESFFNSVTSQILRRAYYLNDFMFVRPAISTEYIEPRDAPTYRPYYPARETLADSVQRMLEDFALLGHWAHLRLDAQHVAHAILGRFHHVKLRANFQLQVLSGLFYRNKGAYAVGKVINGYMEIPFALAVLHDEQGHFYVDAALFGEDALQLLFSFARAYFMVDMEVPSAYVQFLRSLMPHKPRAELYNALGLAKQGKTLFYRDFLSHLNYSSDKFRIAPGIKGMVMLVFDLPSFPFVFKIIKDFYPPQKDTSREQIQGKYLLVKQHDRVGRMADTLEYSEVAFPLERFEPELVEELQKYAPSQIEIDDRGGQGEPELVLKHAYIERRMIPLNLYLQEALDQIAQPESPEHEQHARAQIERSVIEYGNAIKDMVAANIFPGDMLWKNFGVARGGKVVFYDYDEIEYLTDCNFRRVPPPRTEEDELSGEIWYAVGPKDVFPETFGPFLLGSDVVREVFMAHHADLLDPDFWQYHKERIRAGQLLDVFPYDESLRFHHHGAARADAQEKAPAQAQAQAHHGAPDGVTT
ncbi:MAG: bifunctional isocitrate dehydrogenase kinase/phosphatase [Burkholderiaceae bacterium]|jgi:isocitrate dehydrogenase kinase/phosphatase|nr:bifunctional isocitrate dehydrogenase kinase/phosphatase [Burkholderiaceae bacterium]